MFICIKGAVADGHSFALQAAEAGAFAIVCSDSVDVSADITVIQVPDTQKAAAIMARNFYEKPDLQLQLIGVTGTKGKTTTASMIHAMLKEHGIKTGIIGTINIDTGCCIRKSSHTTPEAVEIYAYLREMVLAGCKAAVIEVSSQALMRQRVHGILFDYGVFTNLYEDHIGPGEHSDFAEYAYWKSTLFKACRTGIFNGDDSHLPLILRDATCKIETYGFSVACDLRGEKISHIRLSDKLGMEFSTKGVYNSNLTVALPGSFACCNALAAMTVCSHFDVTEEEIKNVLRRISIPGRAEMFSPGKNRMILVDYAHNGAALQSFLQALRDYNPSKLTAVFGCGGGRDKDRRKKMGRAAAIFADFSIITSDNPRNESQENIISDIISEMDILGGTYRVISDRREAIDYAVSHCQAGEIVAICGKGHEDYQILGDQIIHFDDREEVLASIEKVKYE